MNSTTFNSAEFLSGYKHVLERTTKKELAWMGLLAVLVVWAMVALVYTILEGHIVTGMRDNVVWGIYIVNFIYLLGISYSGALIGGTLLLMKTNWRAPLMRMIEFLTIMPLLIGPLFILLCIGRLDRLHYLFLYPRIQSPITWDVLAIITDIIGCGLFLLLAFIKDFAKLRDMQELNIPKWKRRMYKFLAMGYQDTPEQAKLVKRTKTIMAAMIIAIAIIVYSVLAWLFGVTLQPGWHSTIFGPYFVIAAVFSGSAMLIVVMAIYRKIFHLEKYITEKHFINMGVLMMIMALFFGYFTFSEYITKWYGNEKGHALVINALLDRYFWAYIIAHYLPVLIPALFIGFRKLRSIRSITFSAIIVVIGLWIHRYLLVIPSLENPYIPIQESRQEWLFYSATWVEWAQVIGGFALVALLITIAHKWVPILDVNEYKQVEQEKLDSAD